MSSAAHPRSLRSLVTHCGALLKGDDSVLLSGIASIASAKTGDLVFAEDEVKLDQALRSQATAVIAGEFAAAARLSKPTLIVRNPKLAFAQAAALFGQAESREGNDESAQIHLSAQIGEHTSIGPGVVIDEHCQIGNGTSIGANTVIGAKVIIGQNCRIGPNVTVNSGTELGDRVVVQAGTVLGSTGFGYVRDESGRYQLFPQIGRLLIEDDVDIGANCTIDRGALDATVIHRGAKIDNMVHVGHNVEIGEDVVIAAQTGISGSCRIGNGAVIGGQIGIGDHVEIEAGVILGSGSGVLSHKVVRGKGIVYWGTPARPLKQYLKELATLSRLSQKRISQKKEK
jgi:UDP-3-O-[3-hydroxymyristoyl] glucosamine N-acyltransferase